MDVVDVNEEQFREVELKGHYGVFTEHRVDRSRIPDGVSCYELRHGDDDSYPAALEQSVRVNYFGTVLMTENIELGQEGYVSLEYDDFSFTGEELTMPEYMANYVEEPKWLKCGADLVKFMDKNDMLFHLTEREAELLVSYMSGHGVILGEKGGRLFCGDLCYKSGKTWWREDTIDDVVDEVCEWNYDLIITTQAKIENSRYFADLTDEKRELESLKEDEAVLDDMFDRTKYGKEVEDLAQRMADEFIKELNSNSCIDAAVRKISEAVEESRGLLSHVSLTLNHNTGKAR